MMFMRVNAKTLCVVMAAGALLGPGTGRCGTLSGRPDRINTGANINLTTAGALDWVHWGLYTDTSINRKANVAPQISDFELIEPDSPNTNRGTYAFQFSDNANGYSWSDGAPTTTVSNTTTGVWAYGFPTSQGTGFELTVPADTRVKTLRVYVGAYAARGRFEATLSDGSAPAYVSADVNNVLFPRAERRSAVYTLQFAADSPGQHVRIRYTAEFLYSFTEGNVTLQAAALTAAGVNSPPSVGLTSPLQNSTHAQSSSITLSASASDPDGQVEKVEFYAGDFKIDTVTASPYTATWQNVPAGYHVLTAVAYDDSGNFGGSRPVEIWVHGSGGSLVAAVNTPASSVNLTAEGILDWVHWGTVAADSVDRKADVPLRISDYERFGTNAIGRYTNNYTGYSWTDGTPTPAVSGSKTGIFVTGYTNGFRLTVPADTLPKRLKVYVGLYGARGTFQAYLSDFSAPAYIDTTLDNVWGNSYGVYTIDFQAGGPGRQIIVQYRATELYDTDWGNVTLQSATLSGSAELMLINPRWRDGTFTFQVPTETGRTYTPEYTAELSPVDWRGLGSFAGDGSLQTVSDPLAGSARRFYRVRVD